MALGSVRPPSGRGLDLKMTGAAPAAEAAGTQDPQELASTKGASTYIHRHGSKAMTHSNLGARRLQDQEKQTRT